jgi:peptide/nickel transport system substrate-binding protein
MQSRDSRLLRGARSHRARVGLTLAAATTTLALAACGSSGGSSGSGGSTATGASTGTSSGNASAGTSSKTLTMQFNQPVSLNPALGGTSESDIVFGALDYDSLIYQKSDGSYIPDLATSWGYVPGSHNEVFELKLRKGVRFSDGSAVTAKAVAASLEYFKKAGGGQAEYLATLTSASPTGPLALRLHFSAPEPDLPFILSQYQNAGQIIGPKGIANPKLLTTTSDGTGPYILSSSQSVANSSYTFTQNPHYWSPASVKYKSVVVKVVTDPQTAISSAQSGQIDALTSLAPTSSGPAQSAGLNVFGEPFAIASLVLMDRQSTSSPLSKLPVRQAINYAVNRPSMAKALGGSVSKPTDEVAVPGSLGYDPALADKYAYNVSKAKQLLAAAGYPHGFSLNVLDCEALDPNGDIGAQLKSELGQIGVTLNLTLVPSPAQFVPAALSKKYPADIWPLSQNGQGFAWSVKFGLVPITNAFNNDTATLNSLLNKAGSLPASGQATADKKVDDYLVNNAWYVPLFSLTSVMAVAKSVGNVQPPTLQNTTIDPVAPQASLSWTPAGS